MTIIQQEQSKGQRAVMFDERAVGTFRWVRETSDAEYQAVITHFIKQTKEIFSHNVLELSYTHTEKSRDSILSILRDARTVNRSHYFAAYGVHRIVFVRVRRTLEYCATRKNVPAPWGRSERITSKMEKYADRMLRIEGRSNSETPEGLFTGLELEIQKAIKPTVSKQDLTVFPQVNDLIVKIQSLHALVSDSATTPEEDYFLEEIVNSYLPAVMAGAKAVKGGTVEVRAVAETNFVKQLTLIDSRLQTLLDEISNKALREVEAQTSFLTMKLQPHNKSSRLQLEKSTLR